MFLPDGRLEGEDIALESEDGKLLRIKVDDETGRVTVPALAR